MSRATLKDIAQLARVGVATVDRVLNGRAPSLPRQQIAYWLRPNR